MNYPYKQLFNWKAGNLAPTLIGIVCILLPVLASKTVDPKVVMFGFTFLGVALIRAKSKPTVLGALFAMLMGVTYFFGLMTTVNSAILWTLSIALFAGTIVFELGLFKFGPSTARAKVLTIIPLAMIGFNLILAFAGYNPLIHIAWNGNTALFLALNYAAIMMFCWLYVLDEAGWKPLRAKTNLAMNLLALLAVGVTTLGFLKI